MIITAYTARRHRTRLMRCFALYWHWSSAVPRNYPRQYGGGRPPLVRRARRLGNGRKIAAVSYECPTLFLPDDLAEVSALLSARTLHVPGKNFVS
jgi:hypothetical protein